jgi:hypothetical protein
MEGTTAASVSKSEASGSLTILEYGLVTMGSLEKFYESCTHTDLFDFSNSNILKWNMDPPQKRTIFLTKSQQ